MYYYEYYSLISYIIIVINLLIIPFRAESIRLINNKKAEHHVSLLAYNDALFFALPDVLLYCSPTRAISADVQP